MYSHDQIIKNIKARDGYIVDTGEDGGRAVVSYRSHLMRLQFSFGMGWEHVSVSRKLECPSWLAMCFIKDLFWPDHECVVQYHPAKSEYVNFHKNCLHLWRPIDVELPTPPSILVGPK